jgi:hypothetical protein
VHNAKDALATYPFSISGPDPRVVEDGSLVKLDAATVLVLGKGYLIWVEVVEDRAMNDLIGLVAQYLHNGLRGEENISIGCKVWFRLALGSHAKFPASSMKALRLWGKKEA